MPTISNDTDHPVAVELQLVQPSRIVGKLVHKGGSSGAILAGIGDRLAPPVDEGSILRAVSGLRMRCRVCRTRMTAFRFATLAGANDSTCLLPAISSMVRPGATLVTSLQHVNVGGGPGLLVVDLLEQPVLAVLACLASHADQGPAAPQPFAGGENELSRSDKSPSASPSGSQVPRSQSMTVPPPYSPCGITPSNLPYSRG